MQFREFQHERFGSCLQLSNGLAQLWVSLDFGPRILFFALQGGQNQLALLEEEQDTLFTNGLKLYGGHRLWVAPEQPTITHFPDNLPVRCQHLSAEAVAFSAPPEEPHGLQKSVTIRMQSSQAQVHLSHQITNTGKMTHTIAAWAITMLAPGGKVLLPFPRASTSHTLQAANLLAFWPYTAPSDPRISYHADRIELFQDAHNEMPLKLGVRDAGVKLTYQRANIQFTKMYRFDPQSAYPDLGCSAEVYLSPYYAELESLSPLQELPPGQTLRHEETWLLEQR